MNKRIAKAKTTNKVEPKSATANTGVSASAQKEETTKTVESSTQKTKKEAKEYTLYIQYQNREYNMADLTKQILEKCGAEKMDPADLRIYGFIICQKPFLFARNRTGHYLFRK